MGKSKKGEKFENAMDSIYNLVFGQSSSDPGKRKPVKFQGSPTGSDLMASAFAEIASRPMQYFGESPINVINGTALDPKVFSIQMASADATKTAWQTTKIGELKLKIKDLPKLYTNPDKLVDDVMEIYKQSVRQSTLFQIGRGLDAAALILRAKNKNRSSWTDAWRLGMSGGGFTSFKADLNSRENIARSAVLRGSGLPSMTTGQKDNLSQTVHSIVESGGFQANFRHGRSVSKSAKDFYNTSRAQFRDRFIQSVSRDPKKYGLTEQQIGDAKFMQSFSERVFASYARESRLFASDGRNGSRFHHFYGSNRLDYETSPGMYRETGIRAHEARIASLKQDIDNLSRQMNGVTDAAQLLKMNAELKRLISQMEQSANFVGMSQTAQQLYGYHNMSSKQDVAVNINEILSKSPYLTAEQKAKYKEKFDRWAVRNGLSPDKNGQYTIGGTLTGFVDPIGGPPGFYNSIIADVIGGEISQLRSKREGSGLSDVEKMELDFRIDALEREKKRTTNMASITYGGFAFQIGRVNSIFSSLKAMTDGNLGKAIFNGEVFYDASYNFAPGMQQNFGTSGSDPMMVTDNLFLRSRGGKQQVNLACYDLVIPKSSINSLMARTTDLYYFSPLAITNGSLLRSMIWDGGHAKYIAYQTNMELLSSIQKLLKDDTMRDLLSQANFDFFDAEGNFIESKWTPENFSKLSKFFKDHPELGIAKKMSGLFDRMRSFSQLGHIFGTPQRIWKLTIEKTLGKIRSKFMNGFLQKFLEGIAPKSLEWKEYVTSFISSKLGLQQLLLKGMQMLAQSLNGVIPGLGAAASIFISIVGPKLIESLIKPAMKVLMAFLWSIGILLCGLLLCSVNLFTDPIRQQRPIDTVVAYSSPELAIGGGFSGDGEASPDDGDLVVLSGDCMFDSGFGCSQGKYGFFWISDDDGKCYSTFHVSSHMRGIDSFDIIQSHNVIAPDDGVVTEMLMDVRCGANTSYSSGGRVVFKSSTEPSYEIIYLHVKPSAGLSSGMAVVKGTVIARQQTDLNGVGNPCWTGPHIHVQSGNLDLESFIKSTCKANLYCSSGAVPNPRCPR